MLTKKTRFLNVLVKLVRSLVMAALVAKTLVVGLSAVHAQQGEIWTKPQQLYLLTPDCAPSFPQITADPFGRLHVVAVRNFRDEGTAHINGAVFYTRWDGAVWSEPIDILVAPNRTYAAVESFTASENGQLHILWSELQGGLYWSHSLSLDATSAHAWTTSMTIPGATNGDFAVQGDQNVALVYVQGHQDLFFRRSRDGGQTWSSDVLIWSPSSDNQAIFTVRLAVDANGSYHVAWTETDRALDWNPSGVRYARSIDGGDTWQDYLSIPDEGSYINIGFDADGNVHLLWNHNVGSEDGRYHAVSMDGGKSWAEPRHIFSGLSGRTGCPQMLLDNAGHFHQFTSGRGHGLEGGIYHSTWLDHRWSDPVLISEPVPGDNNEGPVTAVTSGNLLHVIWRNVFTIGDIMYSSRELSVREHPSLPVPTATVTVEATATPVAAPAARASPGQTPQSEHLPQPELAQPTLPLLVGTLPVLILVGAAIVWRSWKR